MLVPIVLSLGALNALVPVIIIIILIAAAAGLSRGTDLFALFGVGALIGVGSTIGAGRAGQAANRLKYNNQTRKTYGNALSATARTGAVVGGKLALGTANMTIRGRTFTMPGSAAIRANLAKRPGLYKFLVKHASNLDKQKALGAIMKPKPPGMATKAVNDRSMGRRKPSPQLQVNKIKQEQQDKESRAFNENLKARGIAPPGIGLRRPRSWSHVPKGVQKANEADIKATTAHVMQQAYKVYAKDSSGRDIRGDLNKLGKQIEAFKATSHESIFGEESAAAKGKDIVGLGNLMLSLKAYQMDRLKEAYGKVQANNAEIKEKEHQLDGIPKDLPKAQAEKLRSNINDAITKLRADTAQIERITNLEIKQAGFAIEDAKSRIDYMVTQYLAPRYLSSAIKNAGMRYAMGAETREEPLRVLGAGLGLLAENIKANIANPKEMIKSSNEILKTTAGEFMETSSNAARQTASDFVHVAGEYLSPENVFAHAKIAWYEGVERRAETKAATHNPYEESAQKLAAESYDNIRVEFLNFVGRGGSKEEFGKQFPEEYNMINQEANYYNSQHPEKPASERPDELTTRETHNAYAMQNAEEYRAKISGDYNKGGNAEERDRAAATERIRKAIDELHKQAQEQAAAQDRQRAFKQQIDNANKGKPPFDSNN